MAKNGSLVRQVSFKKSEAFVLERLEELYKPFSFSNYVKQLIMKDIGLYSGKKHFQSETTNLTTAVKENDFKIDAEREELEL